MNTRLLTTLALLLSLMLLAVQRTEPRRRWLTALVLLLPSVYLLYRWAIYRGRVIETIGGVVIGLLVNVVFWLLYGRRHPPRSSDEIRVIGMDE